MRGASKLVTSLLVLGLTACKISITVPEGGSVSNESGAFVCNAGATCEVEVVDLFFDETFVAQPADGYRFRQWRRQDRGLCGGSSAACRLFTSGFAGNPALLAFLDRDDVFFLDPEFESTDSGSLGSEPLRTCFDADFFRQGARFISEYRRPGIGGGDFIAEFDQQIQGQGVFNGSAATRMLLDQRSEGQLLANNVTWFSIDVGARRLRYYGSEATTVQPPVTSATITLSPFKLNRWDLQAGQSFRQTYTSRFEDGRGSSTTETHVLTTTYLGTESITVPAGTYKACKIREDDVVTPSSGVPERTTETQWYKTGSGILLKAVSDSSSQEFLRGTLNGVAQ